MLENPFKTLLIPKAPGEKPFFLGVRENRLTGVVVFVAIGLSVFLIPILQVKEERTMTSGKELTFTAEPRSGRFREIVTLELFIETQIPVTLDPGHIVELRDSVYVLFSFC